VLHPVRKDWTTDVENVAGLPRASLDAHCECDQLIVAEGTRSGVLTIEGLVVACPVEHP
jgi:hypothetical protein